jgi:D-methionine transport system substrate-binding protein
MSSTLKNIVRAAWLCALATCSAAHAAELPIASAPGPYKDGFAAGIAPRLARQGDTITYVEYSLGLQADDATQRGEVDAKISQHSVYLEASNRDGAQVPRSLPDADFAAVQGNFAAKPG